MMIRFPIITEAFTFVPTRPLDQGAGEKTGNDIAPVSKIGFFGWALHSRKKNDYIIFPKI